MLYDEFNSYKNFAGVDVFKNKATGKIDVLKNLDDDAIDLEVTDSEKPGVIRINGYTYIVLPMRLN